MLHPSFFAREDTKTPMIYSGIAMAANVMLSFSLFLLIGATGIAIATTLSGWINVVLLIGKLRQREGFTLDQIFRRRFAGIVAASAAMGVAVFVLVSVPQSLVRAAERVRGASGGPCHPGRRRSPGLSRRRSSVRRGPISRPGRRQRLLRDWRTGAISSMLQCNIALQHSEGPFHARPATPQRALYARFQPPGAGEGQDHSRRRLDLRSRGCGGAGRQGLARDQVCAAVRNGGYGGREIVIRVNALETPWGTDDLLAACAAEPDAILVPKVVHSGDIISAAKILQGVHASEKIRLWAMMETPMAILNARTIAATAVYAENRLCCLVMGTNDLIKESRARALHDRFAVVPWLAMTLVAARAYRLDIIDGVYNDFGDELGLREECERGRTLGMDGKTLIHPDQVWPCNEIFSPTREEVEWSRKVIDAFGHPENEHKGVIVVEGRMVERLHFAMAQRTVAIAEQIREMEHACA